jgi:Pyridoxamine 5'-phosphate oxidase
MQWRDVAERLAAERDFWLSTVARGGGPHVAPVWGVVVDDVWFCYSERRTVKGRNLAADARAAIHLSDGDDVLIVHGELADVGHPQSHPQVLQAFTAKFARPTDLEYLPSADPAFDVLYALEPRSALAWKLADYDGSQRRWRRAAKPASS